MTTSMNPLNALYDAQGAQGTSATVYVARSLSDDPAIKKQRYCIHKIGVISGDDLTQLITQAPNNPAFLKAPVEIIATHEVEDLPGGHIETLLHRFFDYARIDHPVEEDADGQAPLYCSWFKVHPELIKQAIDLLRHRVLHLYKYDHIRHEIRAQRRSVEPL